MLEGLVRYRLGITGDDGAGPRRVTSSAVQTKNAPEAGGIRREAGIGSESRRHVQPPR